MSLYCFGKLIFADSTLNKPEEILVSFTKSAGAIIDINNLDREDLLIFEEYPILQRPGLTFSLYSGEGESDATVLWINAFEVALKYFNQSSELVAAENVASVDMLYFPEDYFEKMQETLFGSICSSIIGCDSIVGGGIALIDGCIETTITGERKDCLYRILKYFVLPWDCGPNALYVWEGRH